MTIGGLTVAAALIFAALGSSAPAPTPSPSPPALVPLAPLKEIGRVRSSPVCGTLHEVLASAVGSVLAADQEIALDRPILDRYAHDVYVLQATGSAEMDLLRLENTIGPLVHSLLAAQALLGDQRQFPKQAQNDDERLLLESRRHLLEVTDQQQAALNDLNGMLETAQLGELQRVGPEHPEAFSAPEQRATRVGSGSSDTLDAGVAHSPQDPTDLDFSGETGLGYNPVKTIISEVKTTQARIARSETDAAASVLALARSCAQP